MIKEDSMRGVVLGLMFEFGLPWTDCSIEPYGKDLVVNLTKGDERHDAFRYAWNGAQYILLGIIDPDNGEVAEWKIIGDLGAAIHRFLVAVAKALTDEKYKADA